MNGLLKRQLLFSINTISGLPHKKHNRGELQKMTWLHNLPHSISLPSAKNLVKMLTISASTIDWLLYKHGTKFCKRGFITTKPSSIINKHIPVKTNQWDDTGHPPRVFRRNPGCVIKPRAQTGPGQACPAMTSFPACRWWVLSNSKGLTPPELTYLLNDLHASEWHDYFNFLHHPKAF